MSTLKTINVQHPTAASANIVLDNLGNVSIPTSGARITGDFSNATVSNRLMFQSTTVNGNTSVGAIPNGTSTQSVLALYDNSSPDNSGQLALISNSGEKSIRAQIAGTGSYLPMTLYTGGSERMRIDTSGNVGIGTSSPLGRFTSERAAASAGWVLAGKSAGVSNESGVYIDGSNNAEFAARNGSGTLTVRIGSTGDSYITGGNVGIGTSSPSYRLDVRGGSAAVINAGSNASIYVGEGLGTSEYGEINWNASSNLFKFTTTGTGIITFETNTTERARITSGGDLLVGVNSTLSSNTHSFVNTGNGVIALRNGSSTAGNYWTVGPNSSSHFVVFNNNTTGAYILYGGTSWTANSDERLKTDLEPITDASDKVSTLRAVTGRFKTDGADVRRSFLIAQDVQKVLPEAVSEFDGHLGIQYTETIPLLVAAIKELKAELDAVKAELATVKGA